jgi:pyridoxine 4-dehydrogenase
MACCLLLLFPLRVATMPLVHSKVHNRRQPASRVKRLSNVTLFGLFFLYSKSSRFGWALIKNPTRVARVTAGPLTLSEIGCGSWSWGNRLLWNYDPQQDDDIYQAYRVVREAGVTLFDTADSYGTFDLNGRAEVLLGSFERRLVEERASSSMASSLNPLWNFNLLLKDGQSLRNGMTNLQQVATKFAPYPWRITPGSFVSAARASLNRLKQDKLAIAQLHWSTANYQPFQETALWEGLADVYDQGLCEAVGVSNYGPHQLQKIASRLLERQVPLVTAQVQFSLMSYKDSRDMNSACDQVGCRLISYSPLCLGLLTGKYNLDNLPSPGNPRRQLFRELLPGARHLLQTLEVVGAEYGKTQSQVAINWALRKGTVPIPGFRTLDQAAGIVGSVGWELKDDAVAELDRVALAVKKPMIQNVFQTK